MDETLQKKYFKDGVLVNYPKKAEDRKAVLDYMITLIDPEQTYTEIKLNFILKKVCDDFPLLRRELVDGGYLTRDSFGKEYQVNKDMLPSDKE